MAVRKPALGRNLGVLLGDSTTAKTKKSSVDADGKGEEKISQLSLGLLQPGQYQPRQGMEEQALQELADSIKAQGMIQPIVVRKVSAKKHEIIAGERRWRAAKVAGLKTVPVIVREIPDKAAIAMALIENIQREDLNPMEEAQALQRLIEEFCLTHEQAAQAVGKSRTAVSNLLRLLGLADDVRLMLANGDIDMGHARALLSLEAAQQGELAEQIVDQHLNVRQTEALVRTWSTDKSESLPQQRRRIDPDIVRLQDQLSTILRAPVGIDHKTSGKGKIVIKYQSLQQFEQILAYLQQAQDS